MALVVHSSNNFHGIIVDAGNGKVLASTQMSIAGMMMGQGMGTGHHCVMSKPYP